MLVNLLVPQPYFQDFDFLGGMTSLFFICFVAETELNKRNVLIHRIAYLYNLILYEAGST